MRWTLSGPQLACAGLLAALWLGGTRAGTAQEILPPLSPVTSTRQEKIPPPDVDVPKPPPAAQPSSSFTPPGAAADVRPGMAGAGEVVLPTPDGSCPGCEKADDGKPANPWAKIPPVRILPRVGNFPIPPTGPGYYSLLDFLKGNYREKPPRFPYSFTGGMFNSFFDADFRYLDDPKNTQHDIFDAIHRVHLGDNWLFNTGGEIRDRYMHEVNSRLTGKTNTYDLFRTRVYGDLWFKDIFRVYVEFIYADSSTQSLPPAAIDVNRGDLLNAFVDIKLFRFNDHNAYVRLGRQEMLLGSQRLISPLDWANTRRTFNGVRAFRQGEKFDVDLFWLQPVLINPTRFDSVDNNQNFAGAWTTYRPKKGQFIDAYWLFLDNTNKAARLGAPFAPFNVHTLGTRYAGDKNHWLWDVELMLQLGERGQQEIVAGASSLGGGYNFCKLPWNPTFWVYWDYASGDSNPNGGGTDFSTFNQLFPFGHYYLGWLDLVGRQNIHDINAHLWLYPQNWITVWLQYHHFELDQARDALYNAGGAALRRDPTGKAGTNVGDEVDLVFNFHLGPHSDILTGYSHLFAGSFLKNTGAPGDAELVYVQYSFRW